MRDSKRDSSRTPEKSSGKRKSDSRSRSSSSRSTYSRSRSRSRGSDGEGYRLHIGDIGDDIRKADLEKVFSAYGELQELWMTNSNPCFGFAVYKDRKAAAAALKGTDGMELCGSRLKVSNARPRTRGLGRRGYSNNMRCYECGYSGHFYRNCPALNGDNRDRYDRSRRTRGGRDYDRDYDRDSGRRRRTSYRRHDDYNSSGRSNYRSSGGGSSRRTRY